MNTMIRRLALTAGAAAAWFLPWHIALLAVLVYVWASAMTSASNTAKTRILAAQHAALVSSVATTNQNLATTTTTANNVQNTISSGHTATAQPAGVPTSTGSNGGVTSGVVPGPGSDSTGGADNNGVTSGQIGSAPAHYHAMSHAHGYSHYHAETHTHDFDGHTHPLS